MVGPVSGRAFRRPLYSVSVAASLRLATVVLLALNAGGCAMSSSQFGSMFAAASKSGSAAGQDITGATRPARRAALPAAATPSDGDLVYARSAIVEVLNRGKKDQSVPWKNPSSGARGTVTPIASAYIRDGITCQDFLASYLRQNTETWLQGQVCREQQGQWQVRTIKPWAQS
jgi:surface antigen